MTQFTHFDSSGQAHMVDVVEKQETHRVAIASGWVVMQPSTLALTRVVVEFSIDRESVAVECQATVETLGRTGVEMEALTAVSVGLLTIYDMCKAVDRGMRIERVRLLEKKGGRSGHWVAPEESR